MDIQAGIWIDHTKAIIAMFFGEEPSLSCIESNVPQHYRFNPAQQSMTLFYHQDASYENHLHGQARNKMHKYYKRIIHEIEYADQVFICGPDSARLELKKEMGKSKERLMKVVGVERADPMNEEQFMEKISNFYHHRVFD